MGKITGFMELARIEEVALPPQERVQNYREFVLALTDDAASKQGARCMDCGIPFCQSGCPVNNVIPDWNDLVYRKTVARRARRAALDEQFSGIHGPHLSGALRGGVHAQHQRRCGGHQVDRALHHRPWLGRGLGRAVAAGDEDRQARRGGGLRAGRPRLRAAARAGRARRRALREGRPHRRPAPLRDSRLQAGAAPGRPAHGADVHRGRRIPAGRGSRQGCRGGDRCSPSTPRWS